MKTLKFFLFFLAMGFIIIACGSDDPDDGNVDCNDANSVNLEIRDELEAFNAAVSAWINDPSNTALCNNYRDAALDYLDALKALEDCADDAGVGADWRLNIDSAEQALADLNC